MARHRRQCSAEYKVKVVLAVLPGTSRAAEICGTHKIKPELLSRWKPEFLENAARSFEREQERTRIAELERRVGRLT